MAKGNHASTTNIHAHSSGRISLGRLHDKDITSYRAYKDNRGRITLDPCIDIPKTKDLWLEKDKKAMAGILKGIADSKAGRVTTLENF